VGEEAETAWQQGVRGSNPLSSTTGQSHHPAPFGVGLDEPIPDSSGEISERDPDLLGQDQPLNMWRDPASAGDIR
jgi:hypothetical protein